MVELQVMRDERKRIFDRLKKLLKKYEPPFTAVSDFDSRYEIVSKKEVTIVGRKRKEVYFVSIIIQSKYVGLYYMPVYVDEMLKKKIGKELMATLKGKTCFHIKIFDGKLFNQIEKALEIGFKLYKERGWI